MAENKKSVLLYCDIITTVEKLSDDNAGKLFKHYLRYINDKNPEPPNEIIDIVFEPIKQNLKRDLKKWEVKSLKNKENANIRWDKNNANASERIKPHAKNADKDNVTDTVNVKEKNISDKQQILKLRKQKFADILEPFLIQYGQDTLNAFYKYWTEPNKSLSKLRWELEKTWDIELRLSNWAKRDNNFNKDKKDDTKPTLKTW